MSKSTPVAPALAAAEVFDLDGKAHRIDSFWQSQPVLLLFVRHFACIFCREQVNELKTHFAELEKAGVRVVIIGNGNAHFARAFVDSLGLTVPVYTDETRAAYQAASLTHSVGSMLHPGAAFALVRALFACSKLSLAVQGDAQQQGGTFVVKPGGEVAFAYRSRYSGDHPNARAVVAEALAAAG